MLLYRFYNFYISTHYKSEKIKEYFGDGSVWVVKIEYVNEEKPLGTAGSIGLLPRNLPKLPILMMNGDVLTEVNFEHLLTFHQQQKGIATMCIREYDVQIPFGVVNAEELQAKSITEKPIQKQEEKPKKKQEEKPIKKQEEKPIKKQPAEEQKPIKEEKPAQKEEKPAK